MESINVTTEYLNTIKILSDDLASVVKGEKKKKKKSLDNKEQLLKTISLFDDNNSDKIKTDKEINVDITETDGECYSTSEIEMKKYVDEQIEKKFNELLATINDRCNELNTKIDNSKKVRVALHGKRF